MLIFYYEFKRKLYHSKAHKLLPVFGFQGSNIKTGQPIDSVTPLFLPGQCDLNVTASTTSVAAASITPSKERVVSCVECSLVRIANYAAHSRLQFKLIDSVLHIRHAVSADCVKYFLYLRRGVGVDVSRVLFCKVAIL